MESTYDPAILLLDIHPAKTIIQRDTCIPMFIAALFTIAKTWKSLNIYQQRMDKEDVIHIYNGILLSH